MKFRLDPFSPNGLSTVNTASPIVTGSSSVASTSSSSATGIPQYDVDPASPIAEDAWVLRTAGAPGAPAGAPIGILMAITSAGTSSGADTYQLSYRTIEGTTIRVGMS